MSNKPFQPFFLEVSSEYFHCRGKLHDVRDNLRIEVAANESSFMAKGPTLLLSGVHVRITNRTKQNKGSLQVMIDIDQDMRLDLDNHLINKDYVRVREPLGEDCPYTDNQVCCTVALREVFARDDMSLRFIASSGRLVLLVNDDIPPFAELCQMQSRWLAIQTPAEKPAAKAKARR